MKEVNNEFGYISAIVGDTSHKFSTVLYDRDDRITFCIGSFYSKQTFDACLANFQKGCRIRFNNEYLTTKSKSYISRSTRSKDENNCDGVHAMIYLNEDNVIKVYEGENEVDKVFDWLLSNTKTGLIEEWKGFLYDELLSRDKIDICTGYDATQKAPKILVMDKELLNEKGTEVIRTIKSHGLKRGYIKLPVQEDVELPKDMSFVDIIQNLIIPYIETQNCQYNIGDPISPILTSPIHDGNKILRLFPKQIVMAQGLLNAVKNDIDYIIFNGGQGVGKTFTSLKLAYAIAAEKLNIKNPTNTRIAILSQGHMTEKWIRQAKQCYEPLGLEPKFIRLNSTEDVDKLSRKPDGFEIIIFSKDKVKRNYLTEHFEINKYKSLNKNFSIFNDLLNLKTNKSTENIGSNLILTEYNHLNTMKYIIKKAEKNYVKRIVLYSAFHMNNEIEGYYITTTSNILKSKLSKYEVFNKSYQYKFIGTLDELRDIIIENIHDINNEDIIKTEYSNFDNPMVCPHCGAYLYKKSEDIFDPETERDYNRLIYNTITSANHKCNGYIKADGTPLNNKEIDYIRRGISNYKVVTRTESYCYLNEEGEPLKGTSLMEAKKNPTDITILVKVCGEKIVGAKREKGYECYEVTKYMRKKLGDDCIDVSIIDEVHIYSNSTIQGEVFANVCRLSKENIPMTGSLTGGRASDLFRLLYRISPNKMVKEGYKYTDETLFIDHYGRRKREEIKYKETFNKSGYKITSKPWKEIPGISPMLYSKFLANHMVSRKLEDMQIPLPAIKFFKNEVEMDEDLKQSYNKIKNDFLSFIRKHRGINIGGSYINTLASYPDMPNQEPIFNGSTLITVPDKYELKDRLFAKEKKLIEVVTNELKQGRRCLIYVTYTGEKGVSKRLLNILSKKFKVTELKGSKVKVEKREQWIEDRYNEGYEIIITNPECVATGLDIIQYPTIYFYEIPLNTKTLRQAESRGLRPTQTFECRVYYSFYKDTIQQDIILLQSQKKKSSLALEGVFSEDTLSLMSSGGDTIEAMLNKVLMGQITLKENSLDDFGFEEEETYYTFDDREDGNTEVTKTFVGKSSVVMPTEETFEFNLFTIDSEFRKKLKKKKNSPISGQMGFMF